MSSIFWPILVPLCWVCTSLLTWEWEHPQWDTVVQVCRGGLQFDLLETFLLMLLRMWFVLFTQLLVGSYSGQCPLVLFTRLLPRSQCLDAWGWPSQVQNITLHWYSQHFLLSLSSCLSRTSLCEALLFSVSSTPNFLESSKLLRIHSVLLFRSLVLFVTGQQLADGYQLRY